MLASRMVARSPCKLPKYYEAVAQHYGISYLNAQDHVKPSPVDGIHFDAAGHASLGAAIARSLREMA